MTFQDQVAADAELVFLAGDGSGFDVAITHRRGGSADDTASIQAIIDRDNETQYMAGNALTRADRHGERSNANVYLTILKSVDVGTSDTFVLNDGVVCNYVETIGTDSIGGTKTIACIAPNGISTKNPRLRP